MRAVPRRWDDPIDGSPRVASTRRVRGPRPGTRVCRATRAARGARARLPPPSLPPLPRPAGGGSGGARRRVRAARGAAPARGPGGGGGGRGASQHFSRKRVRSAALVAMRARGSDRPPGERREGEQGSLAWGGVCVCVCVCVREVWVHGRRARDRTAQSAGWPAVDEAPWSVLEPGRARKRAGGGEKKGRGQGRGEAESSSGGEWVARACEPPRASRAPPRFLLPPASPAPLLLTVSFVPPLPSPPLPPSPRSPRRCTLCGSTARRSALRRRR